MGPEQATGQWCGRGRRRFVIRAALAAVLLGAALGAGVWAHDRYRLRPTVAIVGDSITALASSSIKTTLTRAGYQVDIEAVPGAKIGQARGSIANLVSRHPTDWILELGTDDAGAHNPSWPLPFLAEWQEVSSAHCVLYVSLSPLAGYVADQINQAIERLAAMHANVHVLDWGEIEYNHPGWVEPDTIHPTPAGQVELASLELDALRRDC